MRRRGLAVTGMCLALVAGAFAAGCSDDSGGEGEAKASPSSVATPAVPPGFTRVTAGRISLAHPPGWVKAPPPQGWSLAMELKQGDVPMIRVGVITSVPQASQADVVATASFAGIQLGSKIENREPNKAVQVPGANGAIRVNYRYEDRSTGNKAQAADLSVVYGDKKAVTVRVTGVQDARLPQVIDQILGTLMVTPG
ncbi:hypothetical protein [Spirillospora sp. CA-294931]|uniref:hypothetical protein n=1 Tax=Spirillospora sp. CA-294931 TaxID=3240042 RepID=UPI003D8F0738